MSPLRSRCSPEPCWWAIPCVRVIRDLVLSRLGKTEAVVTSAQFFREQLASDAPGDGAADRHARRRHAYEGGRRASKVAVYGVDDRFFQFNGYSQTAPANSDARLTPALAREFGAAAGDTVLLRLEKPSAIPRESIQGRKEDAGPGTISSELRRVTGRSLRCSPPPGRCFRDLRFASQTAAGSGADRSRQYSAAAVGAISEG